MDMDKLHTEQIKDSYSGEGDRFADFAESSFSWLHIEKPCYERLLKARLLKDSRVLDVGSGSGRILRFLIEAGVSASGLTALDINPCVHNLSSEVHPDITALHADISEAILPGGSFDLVMSHMVFLYLGPQDLQRAFAKCYSALQSGGLLCFQVPHPFKVAVEPSCYLKREWRKVETPWGDCIPQFTHTCSDYCNFVISAGFRIIELEEPEIVQIKESDTEELQKYSRHPNRLALLAVKN